METSALSTERLTRRGLRLAALTVGYNVVEGVVAVAAGLGAGLVSLIGFGVDSGIESVAGVLVAVRLAARLRHGDVDERRERLTLRLVAATFFLLAAYIVVGATRALLSRATPEASVVGLALLAASVVIMPILAHLKRGVGLALGDNLILADAAETRICLLLRISTLLGLGLFALTGAAWLDPVAGFVIAAFAVHEGREAWGGELTEADD